MIDKTKRRFIVHFFPDFPVAELLSPPAGYRVRFISMWRPGCVDWSWRIVYKREDSYRSAP